MQNGLSRKIYKVGEEILTKIAAPVTEEDFRNGSVTKIVAELITISKEIGAVGFSAPQLGYSKRILIIGMPFNNPRRPYVKPFATIVFVNPETTFLSSEEASDWEGCASFNNTLALVRRSIIVRSLYRTKHLIS